MEDLKIFNLFLSALINILKIIEISDERDNQVFKVQTDAGQNF